MRIIESIVIYLSLVFRPRVLVRMVREYRESLCSIRETNEKLKDGLLAINQHLQSCSCKQGN